MKHGLSLIDSGVFCAFRSGPIRKDSLYPCSIRTYPWRTTWETITSDRRTAILSHSDRRKDLMLAEDEVVAQEAGGRLVVRDHTVDESQTEPTRMTEQDHG
jgi:hypothetical protein